MLCATISASIAGSVWWVLALHFSTPADAARFVTIYGLGMLLAEASNLGVGFALIRYVPVVGSRAPTLAWQAIATVVCVDVVLSGCVTAGARGLDLPLAGGAGIGTLLALLGVSLATLMFTLTDNLLLATGGRITILSKSAIGSAGRVVTLVALCALGLATWRALIVSYALPQLLAAAYGLASARGRLTRARHISPPGTFEPMRSLVPYALQTYAGTLLTAGVPNLLPLIVATRVGARATAEFGALWFIASLLMLIPAAVSLTTFSTVVRGETASSSAVSGGNLLLLAVQIPVMGVVLVATPIVLPLINPRYADVGAFSLAPILVGVLLVGFTSQMYARARTISGGLRLVLAGQALQAVIVLGLAYDLAPGLGLEGVGLAWLAGTASACALVHAAGRPIAGRPKNKSMIGVAAVDQPSGGPA